ncbi:MAG: CPBP family intramembrane metalloprotease [Burkholderiales bacterium]|nr:CPBP family intramembrane metalloprotease [Bacteroidia bacterium]
MGEQALINKSPLKFFLLVFGLSIPLRVMDTLFDVKRFSLDFSIIDILAAFTPLIAACILVYSEEGRVGISNLFKRIFDYSRITNKMWYVPILFLPFFIYFLIYITLYIFELPLPVVFQIPFLSIPLLFCLFFVGAVVEETGYMGYAVDTMQNRFGAVGAAVLIGIPWAVWHYPSIINQGHNINWIAWGTLGTVAVRVLIVWIYNNTGKSLFACILFHTMLNLGRPLFPKDNTHNPLVDYPHIHYSIIAVVTVVVVLFYGKTLIGCGKNSKKLQPFLLRIKSK